MYAAGFGESWEYRGVKHCPLRIDDEFQFGVWNSHENRVAIHGQKDCGAVIDKDKRRVVLYLHSLDGLLFGYVGDDTLKRDVADFRNKGLEELIHLCG